MKITKTKASEYDAEVMKRNDYGKGIRFHENSPKHFKRLPILFKGS